MSRRELLEYVIMSALLVWAPPLPALATDGTLHITVSTTLSEDHSGNVVIAASHVTLNCLGRAITNPAEANEEPGILIHDQSGVTVKNCRVSGFSQGIEVAGSTDVVLTANHAFDNTNGMPGNGILVTNSVATTVKDNLATGNIQGIEVSGSQATVLDGNRIEGSAWAGIVISGSTGTLGRRNVAVDNGGGLELYSSSGNAFVSNEVRQTRDAPAIQVHEGSAQNTFLYNVSERNLNSGAAILGGSARNRFAWNTVTKNQGDGITVSASSDNSIEENRVMFNSTNGISLIDGSSDTKVLGNLVCHSGNVDAFDEETGTGNLWSRNRYCGPPF